MNQRRKIIIAILVILTIALGALGIIISNNTQIIDSNAETSTDFSNCNEEKGSCIVPIDTLCSNVKVYIHECDDIKARGIDCVSENAQLKGTFTSGDELDINPYLENQCGTVQMYLESANSNATSVGACGSIKKTFSTRCDDGNGIIVIDDPEIINRNPIEEPEKEPIDEIDPGVITPEADVINTVSIISQSASTCGTNGSATFTYTITFTNTGTQPAQINTLTENLDVNLSANAITPTAINPAANTISASSINWNLSINLNAGESRSYAYSINIPQNRLQTFVSGINSQSVVSYNDSISSGNTASFNLRSSFSCTIPTIGGSLPNTGILDDLRFFIIGILFITLGYYVYKKDIGINKSLNFMNSISAFRTNTKRNISNRVLNAAPFEEGIEERIKKKIKKMS